MGGYVKFALKTSNLTGAGNHPARQNGGGLPESNPVFPMKALIRFFYAAARLEKSEVMSSSVRR